MRLFELELSRHDWRQLRCGCGKSAEHVADRLKRVAAAETSEDAACDWLDGHIADSVVQYEPAVSVVAVALAALADDVSSAARSSFLNLLLALVAGESTDWEIANEGRDLPEECRSAARDGIWLLYSELSAFRSRGASSDAYEILSLVEPNQSRLDRVRENFGDQLGQIF